MPGKVGFIGLGNMGGPMALNLAKGGFELVVHDIDPRKLDPLVAAGAAIETSPAAVAGACDRTICMVETTDQAEAVIIGEQGVISRAQAGHIVLCMSTIDPFAARRFERGLAERGIAMLDAPVSGGTVRAKSGELSIIVGGAPETYAACEDLFRAMGKNLFHVGALGHGLAMKLLNNMLGQIQTVAIAEALVYGVKAGLDPQKIYEVIRVSTGSSVQFENRVPRMLSATSRRAARLTFRTRTRSWRRRLPSGSACRSCSPTSRSRSIKWRVPRGSTKKTARRSSNCSKSSPA